MDLHPANQGGPDEESALASSQVGSSQTTFKIHRDSLPRRSEATLNLEAKAMARQGKLTVLMGFQVIRRAIVAQ